MAILKYKNGSGWNDIPLLTWEQIYPINSLYFTQSDTSPADSLGGTWSIVDTGYYLRSISTTVTEPPGLVGTPQVLAQAGSKYSIREEQQAFVGRIVTVNQAYSSTSAGATRTVGYLPIKIYRRVA